MKQFQIKKEALPGKIRELPWYMGIPLIVVLAPLFILITLAVLLFVWVKGDRSPLKSELPVKDTWTDWSRFDSFRLRVRGLRPGEEAPLADEWYAQIDPDNQQPLVYAETSPLLPHVHGAILSSLRIQRENGYIVQRLWFVEDEDPALDSELIFIDEEKGKAQVITQAGPFMFSAIMADEGLLLLGANHDERMRIEIS
jgi:hypothetical protein